MTDNEMLSGEALAAELDRIEARISAAQEVLGAAMTRVQEAEMELQRSRRQFHEASRAFSEVETYTGIIRHGSARALCDALGL